MEGFKIQTDSKLKQKKTVFCSESRSFANLTIKLVSWVSVGYFQQESGRTISRIGTGNSSEEGGAESLFSLRQSNIK
jgi:hypothetical protein